MKKFTKIFLYFLAFVLLLAIFLLKPVSSTSFNEVAAFQKTFKSIDSLQPISMHLEKGLFVGYSKMKLIPKDLKHPLIIGNSKNNQADTILDDPYARMLLLSDGKKNKVVVLAFDLMLIHPHLKNAITKSLTAQGYTNLYFSATHTHSSLGGWGAGSLGARFLLGKYDVHLENFVVNQVVEGVKEAEKRSQHARVFYQLTDLDSLVSNRIDESYPNDPYWRTVGFEYDNGQTVLWHTFQAHPVLRPSGSYHICGDYPWYVNQSLEQDENICFSMFSAGGVGSHHASGIGFDGEEGMKNYANCVLKKLKQTTTKKQYQQLTNLGFMNLTMQLPDQCLRISEGWQGRSYVTKWLLGAQDQEYIQILKLGDVICCSTPCDFSGELTMAMQQKCKYQLVPTSFNGGYIGYCIPDHYYNKEVYFETREMNWYGPYTGSFVSQCILKGIGKF